MTYKRDKNQLSYMLFADYVQCIVDGLTLRFAN